ncbi:MAG: ketopantoate reductase family protein [Myxococcota bacterium]|nr:ketopantoate reductase family protein [Myxococcota bacterium]
MKVAVIGAGAVGLALGASLAASGEARVRFFVRRDDQAGSLRSRGARRTGIFGEATAAAGSFDASAQLADLARDPDDAWLVCAKSVDGAALAEALGPVWHGTASRPAVVLYQNGWGNAEIFRPFIPTEHVFNARVITGFEREDDTSVRVTVHADAIHVGHLDTVDARSLAPLCEAIDRAGIPCRLSDDIAKDLWAKVLYNALLNPLGALVGVPYGELGKRKETRALLDAIAHETFAIMHAAGFETHWASADEYLETFYERLLPPTVEHESSMLLDLRAGRRTEIDALCGAVVKLASEHEVAAPLHMALLTLVRAAEAGDERG